MDRVDQLKELLSAEWRSKKRTRLAAYALILILLTIVALDFSQFNKKKIKQGLELEAEWKMLQDNVGVSVWASRLDEISALREARRQTIWKAGSDGLAKAKFQKIAKDFFAVPERRAPTVEVGASMPLDSLESVNKVRARVRLLLSGDELVDALAKIENAEKVVNIERLQLNYSSGRWSADFVLNAFFEIKSS